MALLRVSFRAGEARKAQLCLEVHVDGVVVHAVVDRGRLDLYRGPTSDADLVIEPGQVLRSLLTGEVDPTVALVRGQVAITGAPELLSWFVALFHLPELPGSVAA